MGFRRNNRDQREFRPRLSPTEEAIIKARPAIAHVGEPSRHSRGELMRGLIRSLQAIPEDGYTQLMEILRAVIYEQPHKIGYLSHVFTEVQESLSFYAVEMAHDELVKALDQQNWPRFKLFLRFLCAMHPVIANVDTITQCLTELVDRAHKLAADSGSVGLAIELYKIALLNSLYLPKDLVSQELRESFVSINFPKDDQVDYEFFRGERAPYDVNDEGVLLVESARKLKENDWEASILAGNPLAAKDDCFGVEELHNDTATSEPVSTDKFGPAKSVSDGTVSDNTAIENSAETEATKFNETADLDDESMNVKPTSIAMSDDPKSLKKHTIHSIHLGEMPPHGSQMTPKLFFKAFLPVDGIETVPADTNIAAHLLRDVSVDNIQHMDFNRREVVRQLLVLDEFFSPKAFAAPGTRFEQLLSDAKESPEKPTWKIEDIAVEAILSQLFDLTRPESMVLPPVYYHSLLIEVCVLAPEDLGPVVGRSVRFLFNNLAAADAEVFYRMVDWFAQHVSNFNYTWKWNEWLDTLALPKSHPQQVFIRQFLNKQVRLSYADRVRDAIPEEFRDLVPNPPDIPSSKFEENSEWQNLVASLRDTDGGAKILEEKEGIPAEENKKDPYSLVGEASNPTDFLIHAVCHLGNRSVTHATTWIKKTEKLILSTCVDKKQLVASVFDYWGRSKWIGVLVLQQFVNIKAVEASDIINFVITNNDMLLSAEGWEIMYEDPAYTATALESILLEGEYGEWWKNQLLTSFRRITKQKDMASKAAEIENDKNASAVPEARGKRHADDFEMEDESSMVQKKQKVNPEE